MSYQFTADTRIFVLQEDSKKIKNNNNKQVYEITTMTVKTVHEVLELKALGPAQTIHFYKDSFTCLYRTTI